MSWVLCLTRGPNFPEEEETAMHQAYDQPKSCSSLKCSAGYRHRRSRIAQTVVETDRPVGRGSLPVREVEFAELEGGVLVEIVEHPVIPGSTLLAVFQKGKVEYRDRLVHHGEILLPFPRDRDIFRAIPLPRTAKPYGKVNQLINDILSFLLKGVDFGDPSYPCILAHCVMASWLIDQLDVAPYVFLVGLPQSGKSTLLAMLKMICRRPLLTADVTSAALYQVGSRLGPTLLMDEGGTSGDDRILRHLLRMGSSRESVALRKNHAFNVFGMKVYCSPEPPNDPALMSRGIVIPMVETKRSDLLRPTDPEMQKLALDLQARLFQFRLGNYRKISLQPIPGSEKLRPRTRDLLVNLAAAAANDPTSVHFLQLFFHSQDLFTSESLTPDRRAVLHALFLLAHKLFAPITVGAVAKIANETQHNNGEQHTLSDRKVGSILTSFGFEKRQPTNRGHVVLLFAADVERLHQLAKTHRLQISNLLTLLCRLCLQQHAEGVLPNPSSEKGTQPAKRNPEPASNAGGGGGRCSKKPRSNHSCADRSRVRARQREGR